MKSLVPFCGNLVQWGLERQGGEVAGLLERQKTLLENPGLFQVCKPQLFRHPLSRKALLGERLHTK